MPFPLTKLVIAIVMSLLAGITTPLPASGTDNRTFDCDPEMPEGTSGLYYVDSNGFAFDGGCNAGRLILDNSVKHIEECAFCERELTYVVIPEGVISIGDYAFDLNPELISVTIPDSVISIGRGSFRDNFGLTSVTFGANSQLESIGVRAFQNAESLVSIEIPRSVTSIGEEAFKNASALEYVIFEENSQLESIGNEAFMDTVLESIEIPNTVVSLSECVFCGLTSLTSVTFAPSSQLTSIGVATFGGTSLTSIIIPNSVTFIGEAAFVGAQDLEYVFFGENSQLETIGNSAFLGTSSLRSIELPANLTYIGQYAFSETSLSSITIPESVTTIGDYAFADATSLSNFYFMGNAPELTNGYLAFDNGPISHTAFVQPDAEGFSLDMANTWFGLRVVREAFTPPLPLYRNWKTPLSAITNGPKIGETIYASAFERELPTLFAPTNYDFVPLIYPGPTPEEYVYRITKQENAPASSVDHQPITDYESLSSESQSAWYQEIGFTAENPYQFTWKAFMCVNQSGTAIANPTGLSLSYASREDGVLPDGSFSVAHNTMFKNAATDWRTNEDLGQTLRSAVGSNWTDGEISSRYFLGEGDPLNLTLIWGLLDVNGSCGGGKSLQALTILESADENAEPITTKSFEIPEQLHLLYDENSFTSDDNKYFSGVNPTGITIGVTGRELRNFNAALWGLTTIADSSTPPPAPPSGGGGSSSQTPTPTPSATTSPRATQSANPIIQNRIVTPSQLKPGTTNNPEPLIKKLIEDVSNSLKPIIVNIFTQQSPTPNPFFDSKRALEVATPARDKKVIELPSLVRIDNELQSSKLVVIDNTTVQVVTEGGGMLSVEAKDGVATIPVDNTGKVQMIRSNTVNTNGVGLLPNSEFAVYLFSEPTLLGIGKSDMKGNFYASFIVDKDFPLGNHTLQVNGILSNGKSSSISMPVTVVENADIAHSKATPKSNLADENSVAKANNLSYLVIAIFVMILIFMLFGGSRLFLVAGRRRQED